MIAIAALALAMTMAEPPGDAAAPAAGTISVETAAGEGPAPSDKVFAGAVLQALAARGFTPIEEPGHAGLVVDLHLSRAEVGTAKTPIPAPGPAVSTGTAIGSSLTVTLPTGSKQIVPLQRTQMEIRIRRRGAQTTLWQGSALTVRAAGTAKGNDEVVAADLAEAILRTYPAQSDGIISIP